MVYNFIFNVLNDLFQKSNQLLGPKPFPLDRLMAIFYAIVEGKVAPTANIFSQVNTLSSLQGFTRNFRR